MGNFWYVSFFGRCRRANQIEDGTGMVRFVVQRKIELSKALSVNVQKLKLDKVSCWKKLAIMRSQVTGEDWRSKRPCDS